MIIKIIKPILLVVLVFLLSVYVLVFNYIAGYKASYSMTGKSGLAIVFGAGITKSGEPSPALKSRLDKAIELYHKGNIIKIFDSGRLPETIVMKNYLKKNMINPDDIISDPMGIDTYYTIDDASVYGMVYNMTNIYVFISQKYHIPRIMHIVKKMKINNTDFISADMKNVDPFSNFIFIFRESFAFIKDYLTD